MRTLRLTLYFCVGLLLGAVATLGHAAAVPIMTPAGIASTASGFTTGSGFVGNFSAASFSGSFTTNVAGKMTTMPAAMRMASNAGQFAVNALRLNPAGLAGAAVAAWLLPYGLQWLNGQWVKDVDPLVPSDSVCGITARQCVMQASAGYGNYTALWFSSTTYSCTATVQEYPNINVACSKVGTPTPQPATDADWAAPSAAALPDAAAAELAAKGVPIPLQNPEFNPKYHDVPLGDPRIDPKTGQRMQDKARITPQSDGKSADVQVYSQPQNPDGTPATDPTTGGALPPSEKTPDFCELHPTAMGCQEFGTPEDSGKLTESALGVSSITVQSFGSSAACPAPIQLPKGASFSFEWPCRMAEGVKPFLLALAWLAAGLIVIGAARND